MIIIKLKGGLGNQLFQYACGRALSLRTGEAIKLDITGYKSTNGIDAQRNYSLSHFNIKASIATDEEIAKIKYPYGALSKGMRIFRTKVLREVYVNFNPRIFRLKGNAYLDGFFQTEKYFADAREAIRSDITLKNPLGPAASAMLSEIQKTPLSVSLHVRRGDYVNHPVSSNYNGTCSPEYYEKALEIITGKIGGQKAGSAEVKNIRVFVFSDDIPWVRESMPLEYPVTYVSSPDIADYEELLLMSACRHHVIANSSFSWWGAWLNPRPDKIVVAPAQWILSPVKNKKYHAETVPQTWIRL